MVPFHFKEVLLRAGEPDATRLSGALNVAPRD
jgi:hypothetical protein